MVTISLVTATTVIVVVTMYIVLTIEIVIFSPCSWEISEWEEKRKRKERKDSGNRNDEAK